MSFVSLILTRLIILIISLIEAPATTGGEAFHGQDACYTGNQPSYTDNGDGTVTDNITGLMWEQDMGVKISYEDAITKANTSRLGGHTDWRVPTIKELYSLILFTGHLQNGNVLEMFIDTDYFNQPEGNPGHYPHFWTSTTHLDGSDPYSNAVYFAFGEGLGMMNELLMDVHGAGCQRSDPKKGDLNYYPIYLGPQGDLRCVYNHVRCVRDITE